MAFDRYALLAGLLALALLATLRITFPAVFRRCDNPALRLISHEIWLLPLLIVVYMAVGMYLTGKLSPWPPAAHRQYADLFGAWAGVTAFLAALITDIWLLLTPTQVLRRFTAPERRERLKYFQVFNLLIGAVIFALAALR